MKVYRFYKEKAGRFYMHSVLIDDSEEGLNPPKEFCKAWAFIDPIRIDRQSIRFEFSENVPFPVQLDELRHFEKILSTMFNVNP